MNEFNMYLYVTVAGPPLLSAAMAQRLRRRTCTQRTWIQLLLVPIGVNGGGRKGIWQIFFPCQMPILIGTSERLNKEVNHNKSGHVLDRITWLLTKLICWSKLFDITCLTQNVAVLWKVGCGAIGCEMLKNYALLGVCTSAAGGKVSDAFCEWFVMLTKCSDWRVTQYWGIWWYFCGLTMKTIKNDGTAIGWRKTKGTFRHGFSKWSIKNELNSECCAV